MTSPSDRRPATSQISYDYEAKGRADFGSGKKDEKLYANGESHGADYRRGWQGARRAKEAFDDDRLSGFEHAGQTPVAAPSAVSAPPPSDDPPWASEATPQPADGAHVTLAPSVDQLAGTAGSDAEQPRPAPSISRESVRLAAGEDKPRKTKKPDPSPQLDLFS